jgi:hypothetical protein
MKPTVVFDTEVYANYFLLAMRNVANGKTKCWEMYPGSAPWPAAEVLQYLRKYRLVSFNGLRFDMPLIMMACTEEPCERIKEACNAIIVEGLKHWDKEFLSRFPDSHYNRDSFDHIDLIEVAPGQASLKIYGGRLHSQRMQDLPIDPSALITPEQRDLLRTYCLNDLQTTQDLFESLMPQIELRETMSEQYGLDLRSKSDAQIAEAVIRTRVQEITGTRLQPSGLWSNKFNYKPPAWIRFETPAMQDAMAVVLESVFTVKFTGAVEMPEKLEKTNIIMGRSCYHMGIGGLHSTEECAGHVAVGCRLVDRDVASYYPSIILNERLAPDNMGGNFGAVYRDIYTSRLKAKHSGEKVKADSLKIVLNGSFGKFGSPYSVLYSPTLLIQTTITGQLALLMLIEMLEQAGISVVSANTDGILIKCPAGLDDDMERIVWVWETITGFETEDTEYRAMYARDVNNYVAIKPDGKAKLKGVFAPAGLAKNPTNAVCIKAVLGKLIDSVPVEQTIQSATDIRDFVSVKKVAGGGIWGAQRVVDGKKFVRWEGGQYLGKAVRWYYSIHGQPIHYASNGNKVGRSDGAMPCMELPDSLPEDLDFNWYITEAHAILAGIGFKE